MKKIQLLSIATLCVSLMSAPLAMAKGAPAFVKDLIPAEKALKPAPQPTIVDVAVGNESFTTLVAAVIKADLLKVLSSRRQLTVFAPTDAAFDAAAEALLGEGFDGLQLIDALDAETLRNILLYHVAPGSRYSGSVLESTKIRTMNKDFIGVELVYNEEEELTGVTLVGKNSSAGLVLDLIDIPASNGVIHVIDFVLLP